MHGNSLVSGGSTVQNERVQLTQPALRPQPPHKGETHKPQSYVDVLSGVLNLHVLFLLRCGLLYELFVVSLLCCSNRFFHLGQHIM